MTLDEIRAYLKAVAKRPIEPIPDAVRAALATLKRDAVGSGDQVLAKFLWCYEQSLDAQEHYLCAFRHLKAGEYYAAWCELEQTEVALRALERHKESFWADFRLDFVQTCTAKWQGLFPYRLFYSPEFLQAEKVCSICRKPVLPRSFCGHRVGEIYDGEACYRIVTKIDLGGVSIVDKPVQKYSVLFLRDDNTGGIRDQYNYALVEYPIKALRDPFDGWEVERTTRRQPHSRFAHVGRNDPCPCDSGKKYKKCCLREAGVLRPHFEYTFEFKPPDDVLLDEVYLP
jgi:hypothetical protein